MEHWRSWTGNVGRAAVVIPICINRVLIMRRSSSDKSYPMLWNFPGGMVERDETPVEGAIRELKEESDLDAREDELTKIGVFDENGVEVHLYRLDIDDPKVKLRDGEHDQYAWVPKSQIECYNFIKPIRESVMINPDLQDIFGSNS